MGKPTAAEKERHDCLCEVMVQAWEGLPEHMRPSYAELAGAAKLTSATPIWALLNRRSAGRPSAAALRKIANAEEMKVLKLGGGKLDRLASVMELSRGTQPLVFRDGRLPAIAGDVSPFSFICEHAVSRAVPILRKNLLTEAEKQSFPYQKTLLETPLRVRFDVLPDQLLESRVCEPSSRRSTLDAPQAFCLSLAAALELDRELQAQPNMHRLDGITDLRFQTCPGFAILERRTTHHRSHVSAFAEEREKHGLGGAIGSLRTWLQGKHILATKHNIVARNLEALILALFRPDSATDVAFRELPQIHETGNARFALHHLEAGDLKGDYLVAGNALHYWAATCSQHVRVLVSDLDLFGFPAGWKQDAGGPRVSRHYQGQHDEFAKHIGLLELPLNADTHGIHIDTAKEPRWVRDDAVIVLRSDGLSPPEREMAARFFREAMRVTKPRWHIKSNRDELAAAIVGGYDDWGGIGVNLSAQEVQEFIDDGMYLRVAQKEASHGGELRPIVEFTDVV